MMNTGGEGVIDFIKSESECIKPDNNEHFSFSAETNAGDAEHEYREPPEKRFMNEKEEDVLNLIKGEVIDQNDPLFIASEQLMLRAKAENHHKRAYKNSRSSTKRASNEAEQGLLLNDSDSDLSSWRSSDSDCSSSSTESLLEPLVIIDAQEDENFAALQSDIWSDEGAIRQQFTFTADSGVKISSDIEASNVLGIFESVVTDDIIGLICRETNKYAANSIANVNRVSAMKKHSRMREWKDISEEEMRLFEGVLLLMSVIHKPTLQSYFSRSPLINTQIFAETMKRDRFLLILKFLHFSDSFDPTKKLHKIDDLLKLYRESFKRAYVPFQDISINKSLLLWKGRISWKMYIPLRRTKFGIEAYMLCESDTGYVYDFVMYTGKTTQIPISLPDLAPEKQNQSMNIVLYLMEDLLDKGYFLGIDQYLSSVFLFDYLALHKTDVIGTVRPNGKGLPKRVFSAQLKKGETSVMYRKKTMLMRWRDKRDVVIMSTIHDDSMQATYRRGLTKQKPKVYLDYKDKVAAVDTMDQFLLSTNIAKTHLKKYYKKIYFRFLDLCVSNSHVIHKKLGGNLSLFQFKLELIAAIFTKYGNSTEKATLTGRMSLIPTPSRLTGRHFVEDAPINASGRSKRRNCAVCTANKKRTQVAYLCKQCRVPLCPTKCFEDYHTKANF